MVKPADKRLALMGVNKALYLGTGTSLLPGKITNLSPKWTVHFCFIFPLLIQIGSHKL